jgi:hypothetical protein
MRISAFIKGTLVTMLLLAVGAVFLLKVAGPAIGGVRYSNNPADLRKLDSIRSDCLPVMSALEDYHSKKGVYPRDLSQLNHSFQVLTANAIQFEGHNIYYHSESGVAFSLYIKVSWDAGLRYHSGEGEWAYDPGDGSEGFLLTQSP